MSVIKSPKSMLTRGRLVNIQGGSRLQPALVLDMETRGKLTTYNEIKKRKIFAINEPRKVIHKLYSLKSRQPKLEMRHVG